MSLVSICLFSAGCAFTRSEVKVSFASTVNAPLNKNHKSTLEVGEFTDSRMVMDKYVLLQKRNAYGRTKGAFVTKEPVADLLRDGVATALERNGFLGKPADYRLIGNIQAMDLSEYQGFLKSTVEARLTVRFDLIEAKSEKSIWHDSFAGRAKDETAWDSSLLIGALYSKASDELIANLVTDPTFRGLFENSTSSP